MLLCDMSYVRESIVLQMPIYTQTSSKLYCIQKNGSYNPEFRAFVKLKEVYHGKTNLGFN